MSNTKTGVFICELRKMKGLSQEELGSMLYVTKKAVSRWETGRGLPDSSLLLPLAEILDVKVEEILKGEFICNDDLEQETRTKIEKMNAVFNYLTEQKQLKRVLVAYVPIAFIFILNSLKFLMMNRNDVAKPEGVYPLASVPMIYIPNISHIFIIATIILLYRILRMLYFRRKTK